MQEREKLETRERNLWIVMNFLAKRPEMLLLFVRYSIIMIPYSVLGGGCAWEN